MWSLAIQYIHLHFEVIFVAIVPMSDQAKYVDVEDSRDPECIAQSAYTGQILLVPYLSEMSLRHHR